MGAPPYKLYKPVILGGFFLFYPHYYHITGGITIHSPNLKSWPKKSANGETGSLPQFFFGSKMVKAGSLVDHGQLLKASTWAIRKQHLHMQKAKLVQNLVQSHVFFLHVEFELLQLLNPT